MILHDMVAKILSHFSKEDLRKFLVSMMISYLCFFAFWPKEPKVESIIQVDYFSGEDKGSMIPPSEHGVAEIGDDAFLVPLCRQNATPCAKIIYSGDFLPGEKVDYVSQYFDIFSFIDKHLAKGNPISSALKTFILNANKGKRRGGATASRITINLASMGEKSEYRGVLSHEFGHVVDLGSLQGKSRYKDANYTEFGKPKFAIDDPSLEYYRYSWLSEEIRKESAHKKDFCSGYGMTNPFEDFAECHNLYLNHASLFRQMAQESVIMKNKYNYLANLFANAKLGDKTVKMLYSNWRPWDTTVL